MYQKNTMLADVSNDAYHSADGVSKSSLDLVAKSPAHYYYAPPREPSRAMVIGSATHAAILEPDLFAQQYAVVDVSDRRSSVWKEAVAARGEDSVLTRAEHDNIAGMVAAVRANPAITDILNVDGMAEHSLFTTDPVTGLTVKIRPDWLTKCGKMRDLKTTKDASDEGFGKSVANYRYHVQQAFYQDVFKWAFGELPDFAFWAVESEMPHCTTVIRLPHDVVQYARKLYRENLNTLARCIDSGDWPGIPSHDHVIMLPGWFIAEVENATDIDLGDE